MVDLAYPISKIHENIALRKDNSAVAFYRIPNTPITVTDKEAKQVHKGKVLRVLAKLAKQKYFEIALVPKDYLLEEKMRDFSKALADDSLEIGKKYLEKIVTDLTTEMEIPFQYDWIVGVDIRKNVIEESVVSAVGDKLNFLTESVAGVFNFEVIGKIDWWTNYEVDEQTVFQTLNPLKAKRLSDDELFYYQRMQYLRYIPHLKEDVLANRESSNVTDTRITVLAGGYLKLESAYGKSFVDILPVGEFPTVFNGFHIAEFTQRFAFPIEIRMKANFIDNNSIKGTMARSNIRYLNIMQEAHSTKTVQQQKIVEGMQSLKDLMKKVGDKESLVEFSSCLVVSASSLSQLKTRRKSVLNYFEDLNVGVQEAKFDTPYLFQSNLYGQRLSHTTRHWNHLVTVKGFCEQMLFTNTFSGNRIGWYIGRVDNNLNQWESLDKAVAASKNLVLFNPTVGNKEDIEGKQTKNPHIAVTGATGEGKSYLSQLIFLLTSMLDVKQLYIDPKRAVRKQFEAVIANPDFQEKYPYMVNHIRGFNFVTLDSTKKTNRGVLDPIVILAKDDAISTAKNMLLYLLADEEVSLPQKTALGNAINNVVDRRERGEQVGFNQVLELLQESEDIRISELGEYLVSVIRSSILELAFSDGDVKGLDYNRRITILEVADLALPKSSEKKKNVKMSDHEQKSIALMFALGAFCRRFGEMDQYEDTIEYFDEAWVLMESAEGRAIIESMKRIGRHYSNILFLITQSIRDTQSEDDATGFGTVFAFKQPTELAEILNYLGLEDNEKNQLWLSNMISGQCLYKDVYGNLNMISVHTNHKDIDELLSPMKETVSSSLENKYAH